jgi:Mn2+/Fe2+ NRAMP family transporter
LRPAEASRFALVYTIFIFTACLPIALGADPLKLTLFAMAATALILPLIVLPFLIIMNDKRYLHNHTNSPLTNAIVCFVILMAAVMAIVAIPLEIFGGH